MNEFPLKRNNEEGLLQKITDIFNTMSKNHRVSFSPHNISNQDLHILTD